MTKYRGLITIVCLSVPIFVLFFIGSASADVTLPHVFGSHMVLQRDMEIPVWGWAEPSEEVMVVLGQNKKSVKADGKGNWSVKLPAMSAGGPHQVTVSGKNTIELTNVLVGEVWVCSGQSNMQWPVNRSQNSDTEIAAADYPEIRLFQVPREPSGVPARDVDAGWQPTKPDTVAGFSAVAYFFGRHLYQKLGVPIGLINTSWGGTRIEPWTPITGFKSVEKLQPIFEEVNQTNNEYKKTLAYNLDEIEAWVNQMRDALATDGPIRPVPYKPHPLNSHQRPTGLYNGMVHPLIPFAIRGALWYQGESNLQDQMMYNEKMKGLIRGWRKVWGQGDFPFYFVQLAPFIYNRDPTLLPQIWEAQAMTLSEPNTGMAVTTDIGNVRDIHPTNKQDVGKRLALWALAKTYGLNDVIYSGPLYSSMATEGNKIRIRFDHIGGGLTSRDGKPLTWFEIAGADKNFVTAQAEVNGGDVAVWSADVAKPVAVRFGWRQDAEPNLMNIEGLPASPFRTDRW